MPVKSPLPSDTRSRLADWLEIVALTTSRGVATRADVLGLHDLLGDEPHDVDRDVATGEEMESEILENERFGAADAILEELARRHEILGENYPFAVETRGQDWRLVQTLSPENQISVAHACYVFCLLTSAIRDRRIQGAAVPALEVAVADHFQLLATESAAGVIGGVAVSFGWPRPEGTAFRPALKDLSDNLRLGRPLDTVPLWASGKEKDAGIDVIAWRDFKDGRPGKLVLLGQVASGNNWIGKSVKSDTHRFLSWFSERPMQHFIPAIFIPFPQHHDCMGWPDQPFESIAAAEAWLREQEFGLVVDRTRIVETAAGPLSVNRPSRFAAIEDWISNTLDAAKAAR